MTVEASIANISNPAVRHEFVLLFDVTNGNPNGNPDAANAPRTDPETQLGFVTDVAIKRKVRDYLQLAHQTPMFIQSRVALNTLIEQAQGESGGKANNKVANKDVRNTMMGTYYDIRLFGAVLSTGKVNAGQVRGPVQVTFARSIDRVLPIAVTITRQARTTEERMETGSTEIGRKSILPYGLYRARGEMAVRGLYVFSHDNALGKAPAHKLFQLIQVPPLSMSDAPKAPRAFEEYKVQRSDEGPVASYPGVKLTVLTEG